MGQDFEIVDGLDIVDLSEKDVKSAGEEALEAPKEDKSNETKDEGTVSEPTKVEEKVDEVTPVQKENGVQQETPQGGLNYRDVVNLLSKNGVLDDLKDVEFDVGGKTVKFEDLDLSNKDNFVNLMKTVSEYKKEDLLKNKIDSGSVSDFTKRLIDAEKNGVNIVNVLHEYEKYKSPMDKLDITTKEGQLSIIEHYYKSKGLGDDETHDIIVDMANKPDDVIEAKANKYKGIIDEHMNELIEQKEKEAKEQKARNEQELKNYKKSLKDAIQTSFQVNDKMVTKMMDYVFKPVNKEGDVFRNQLNEEYRKRVTDPSTAPDVIMFLMDPEEYARQKASGEVKKVSSKVMKMISATPKTRSGIVDDGTDDNSFFNFEDAK